MRDTATDERFTKDVERHALTILQDDGVRRHLRCSRDGSMVFRFDIITWPGYLAYVGDMGDYVFTRTDDMFGFFGSDGINPDYWSEKCVASGREGIREFSEERYIERITEWRDETAHDLNDGYEGENLDAQKLAGFMAAVSDELLDSIYDLTEEAAHALVSEFSFEDITCGDSWEWDFNKFTFHYVWACRAIVWAIGAYRALTPAGDQS